MIKITQRITASAVWNIEGTEVQPAVSEGVPVAGDEEKNSGVPECLKTGHMRMIILDFVRRFVTLEGWRLLQSVDMQG